MCHYLQCDNTIGKRSQSPLGPYHYPCGGGGGEGSSSLLLVEDQIRGDDTRRRDGDSTQDQRAAASSTIVTERLPLDCRGKMFVSNTVFCRQSNITLLLCSC